LANILVVQPSGEYPVTLLSSVDKASHVSDNPHPTYTAVFVPLIVIGEIPSKNKRNSNVSVVFLHVNSRIGPSFSSAGKFVNIIYAALAILHICCNNLFYEKTKRQELRQ
jgi:hypothetical protein